MKHITMKERRKSSIFQHLVFLLASDSIWLNTTLHFVVLVLTVSSDNTAKSNLINKPTDLIGEWTGTI